MRRTKSSVCTLTSPVLTLQKSVFTANIA